ncbi:MAG: polysaccharide biosynthesis C-terminal domain-containing protein, partial [Halobacteria archaeon]|nr:polysaccharide biosynthesis C-terminal domain-containing protein [Halobacteria archaeon]
LAQTGVAYAGLFLVPGLVGGLVLGEVILSVYSQEFQQGYLVLVLLILARLISTYKNQFVNVIDAINKPDVGFKINAVFVVTNVSLNFVLVYFRGWIGAAVATAVSAAVGCVLAY